MADPNPLLSLNYFIFMGISGKIGQTAQIEPPHPSANLNPRFKNPGSAPACLKAILLMKWVSLDPTLVSASLEAQPFFFLALPGYQGYLHVYVADRIILVFLKLP